MKKIYIIVFLAVLSATTAIAGNFERCQGKISRSAVRNPNFPEAVEDITPLSFRKQSVKSIDPSDLSGYYIWTFVSNKSTDASSPAMEVEIQIMRNMETNSYTVDLGGWMVQAEYIPADGTLSFPADQFLGHDADNDVDVYFYHGHWTSNDYVSFLTTPMVADVESDAITFDPDDMIAIGQINVGWFVLADYCSFASSSVAWEDEFMPATGWKHYGTAMFADPWVVFGTGADPIENAFEVEIEYNEDEADLYRIVNPYGVDSPYYAMNDDKNGKGYIAFSLADPEFVLVYPYVYSGYMLSDIGAMLCTNQEGYFAMVYGASKEEIFANLGEFTPSSYSEGVVELRNCRFSVTSSPDRLKAWNGVPGTGRITFTEINAIKSIGEDGVSSFVPEYYNLQGMRVMNPDNGIYIKKQGSKIAKVRVTR